MLHRLLQILFICACMLMHDAPQAQSAPRQERLPGPVSGKVLDVLDGDTLSVSLHVWIGQELQTHVRIAGIDTPELRGACKEERALAAAARQEVARLLQDGAVTLSDIRLEKYAGRVLARAATADGVMIADHLIEKGYARPYSGKKRQSWCG